MPKIVSDGALIDPRTDKEKEKDYTDKEIASAGVSSAFANPKIVALSAKLYSQEYTNSCVPHGFLTQAEYEGFIPAEGISQILAYRKRSNYPNAGSAAVDMYTKILEGVNFNYVQPVYAGMNDSQANALPLYLGDKLVKPFLYFSYTDYAKVPADIAAGKAVAMFIYATEDEWAREYVEIKSPNLNINDAYVRHCVCLVPKGDFTENGKKWLTVHDSAKFGGRHLRYVSYDFFLKRAYYASKITPKVAPVPQPPVPYKPVIACAFGQSSDAVRTLQQYLASKGYLGAQYITGYYGAITAKKVLVWQLERWEAFKDDGGVEYLLSLEGKYWGKKSIALIE